MPNSWQRLPCCLPLGSGRSSRVRSQRQQDEIPGTLLEFGVFTVTSGMSWPDGLPGLGGLLIFIPCHSRTFFSANRLSKRMQIVFVIYAIIHCSVSSTECFTSVTHFACLTSFTCFVFSLFSYPFCCMLCKLVFSVFHIEFDVFL